MKTSQLIEKLQSHFDIYGDLDIKLFNSRGEEEDPSITLVTQKKKKNRFLLSADSDD